MTQIIKFTDVDNPDGVLEKPKPASEYIPEWYKNAKAYLSSDGKKIPSIDGVAHTTVKKCLPVWDIMTAGYIIETPYDIYVRQTTEGPHFQWGKMNHALVFHRIEQAQDHPYFKDINYAIRINHPWSIKTPKGWSVIIIEPQHREPGPIICTSGIVDTDNYSTPFNIFLKLRDQKFEGMIPAGTPFAQVIPFKRESWKSELGGEKEKKRYNAELIKFGTVFFDKYKRWSWNKKEYK